MKNLFHRNIWKQYFWIKLTEKDFEINKRNNAKEMGNRNEKCTDVKERDAKLIEIERNICGKSRAEAP